MPAHLTPPTATINTAKRDVTHGGADTALKILVVDDSMAFRKVMVELLARAGQREICEAGDFEEALESFRKDRPDIVFADMVLPGRSGVELTQEILRIDLEAKVIAMSSIMNRSMIQQSLDVGAKDFILKPTNEIAINSVLNKWSG